MIFNTNVSSKQIGSFDLIWENATPSVAFSQQTLNLRKGYSAYAIEFNACPTNSNYVNTVLYVPFSTTTRYFNPTARRDGMFDRNVNCAREIVSAIDGAIEFGTAVRGNVDDLYGGRVTDNTYAVPVAIYGMNFTL